MGDYIIYTGGNITYSDASLNQLIANSLEKLRENLPTIRGRAEFAILKLCCFDNICLGDCIQTIYDIINNKLEETPFPEDFSYVLTNKNYADDITIFININRYTGVEPEEYHDTFPRTAPLVAPLNIFLSGFDNDAMYTNRQYMKTIRNVAYDSILTYDCSSANPTREIGFSNFNMLATQQILPYSIDLSDNTPYKINNETYSHTVTTRLSSASIWPISQTNSYEYYIYNEDLSSNPIKIVDSSSNISNTSIIIESEKAVCILIKDITNSYMSSCHYTSFWKQNNPVSPVTTFTLSWSASIGWLNDPRSIITIDNTTYRILLNVSNNSV